RTVGAGGGSIARIDASDLLEVGPQSAGARPGPICFGRGGERPTISDANLLLGRLNPARLTAVDGDAASDRVREIFERELGDPLGLSAAEAAQAVVRVANAKMAGAIRMVSLSLGADPRDYALFAFGGAGPLHAAALARELGVPRVLVPARPGLTNALGCVVADLRHDYVRTVNLPLEGGDMDRIRAVFAEQCALGEAALARETAPIRGIRRIFSADMQFMGQSHVVRVPLDDGAPDRDTLRRRFEAVYWERFKVELSEIRARVVNLNVSVIGDRDPVDLSGLIDPAGRAARAAPEGARQVLFDDGWAEAPVYRRAALPPDVSLTGPAVIEQRDATLLVPPGDRVEGAADGNLILHVGGGA
ncbi:MAG: hydantoinase/oxoprolinase family protein, partial [Pseudomonadota bacterium]